MIRKATLQDVDAIHALVHPQASDGKMLDRTHESIAASLRDFFVYEGDGQVRGTCCLVYGARGMVEVRSLVVHPEFYGNGIGRALVQACIDDALELGYEFIFALTYVPALFYKLGYRRIERSELPDKIWNDCRACHKQDYCDETAVIRPLVKVDVEQLPEALTDPGSDPAISI